MKFHVFDRALDAISKITDDAGTTLIPVYTNIRHLCDERELWLDSFSGRSWRPWPIHLRHGSI